MIISEWWRTTRFLSFIKQTFSHQGFFKKSLKYEQKGLAKPGVSVCSEITFPFGDREPGQQTSEKKVSSDLPIMNMVVNA